MQQAKIAALMLTIVIGLAAASAFAQSKPAEPLSVVLAHQKVAQGADGKETLVKADAAKPGDVIEYQAVYENIGKRPLSRVEATLPVPEGTELLPNSIRPGQAKASLDGVNFQAMPLKRKVKQADGKEVEELVPYAQYRFLRWSVGIMPPGAKAAYAARVKVSSQAVNLSQQNP
jgi:uncharacterized repeat protein (TIGR01451 family)